MNFVRYHFGLAPLPSATIRSFVGDGAWMLVERSLAGLPSDAIQEGFHLFRSHYFEHCADFSYLYPDCRETLSALNSLNISIAIVTNKPDYMSRRIINSYHLADDIHLLIGGDSAAEKKPSPLPLLQALAKLGYPPENTIMVGDSANDIDAARAAGISSCGVTYGFSSPVGSDGSMPAYSIDGLKQLYVLIQSI